MAQPQRGLPLVAKLHNAFSGTVLQPGDTEYDNVRALHNGLIDKHPAVIARCRNDADIAASIAFAREHGLEIAVRGGGHNVSGRASVEGGMMIDLSLMKAIDSECRDAARDRPRRRHLGRVQSRDAAAWPCDDRRSDLHHGHRRTDPRRRLRLPGREAWVGDR